LVGSILHVAHVLVSLVTDEHVAMELVLEIEEVLRQLEVDIGA
jgi:hypothetical protein